MSQHDRTLRKLHGRELNDKVPWREIFDLDDE